MSTTTAAEVEVLRFSLANDPDLGEIVEMFVEEMPGRIEALVTCLADGDWDRLGKVAHQMKGACGSYGFHQLTQDAARVETACRVRQPEEQTICEAVEDLVALCRRVRSGTG